MTKPPVAPESGSPMSPARPRPVRPSDFGHVARARGAVQWSSRQSPRSHRGAPERWLFTARFRYAGEVEWRVVQCAVVLPAKREHPEALHACYRAAGIDIEAEPELDRYAIDSPDDDMRASVVDYVNSSPAGPAPTTAERVMRAHQEREPILRGSPDPAAAEDVFPSPAVAHSAAGDASGAAGSLRVGIELCEDCHRPVGDNGAWRYSDRTMRCKACDEAAYPFAVSCPDCGKEFRGPESWAPSALSVHLDMVCPHRLGAPSPSRPKIADDHASIAAGVERLKREKRR